METNKSNWSISEHKTNEEYIEEINTLLQPLENYKLRWFYRFIRAKLEMDNE